MVQLAALGRLSVAWAVLDAAIQTLLCSLAQAPHHLGQALTEDLGPDNRVRALKRLAESYLYMLQNMSDDPRIQFLHEVKCLATWFQTNKTLRNKIAHWIWFSAENGDLFGFKFTTQPRSSDYGPSMTLRMDELISLIEGADEHTALAFGLMGKAETLPAWHDIAQQGDP